MRPLDEARSAAWCCVYFKLSENHSKLTVLMDLLENVERATASHDVVEDLAWQGEDVLFTQRRHCEFFLGVEYHCAIIYNSSFAPFFADPPIFACSIKPFLTMLVITSYAT